MQNFSKDQLLSYLIQTLEEAELGVIRLDMGDWINARISQKHFCGYAACVCGFVALRTSPQIGQESPFDYDSRLRKESGLVEKGMITILGQSLSDSISSPEPRYRWLRAEESGLFIYKELGHPHLNSESSIEHAISYLKMLKEKLV